MARRLRVAMTATFVLVGTLSCTESDPPATVADAGFEPDAGRGCPTHIRFETVQAQNLTHFGYSGFLHNLEATDGRPFTSTLDCDDECRVCRFSGVVRNSGSVNNQRCLLDTSVECETNEECAGNGNRCVFFLAPANPVNVGGGEAGNHRYFPDPDELAATTGVRRPALAGTIDLRNGETVFDSFVIVALQNQNLGDIATWRGWPTSCEGDTAPNDGIRDGTCTPSALIRDANADGQIDRDPSPRLGSPCDANAAGLGGNYSYDCALSTPYSEPLTVETSLTSLGAMLALSDDSPMCTDPAAADKRCYCGHCSNTPSRGCASDADCPGGTCGWAPPDCIYNTPRLQDGMPNPAFDPTQPIGNCLGTPWVLTKNNNCVGAPCDWDPATSTGTCQAVVGQDPQGMPILGTVGCYPEEPNSRLELLGSQRGVGEGEYIVETVAVSCLPPDFQNRPLANFQIGLPGPIATRQGFRIQVEFR